MSAVLNASKLIASEVTTSARHWVVAYSGGKDSSLVLALFWSALKKGAPTGTRLTVLYCDTGSENPLGAKLARDTLEGLDDEGKLLGINADCVIVRPDLERRLMVRIAGRGYPPPNTFFRWCTKDIRVRPVQNFLSKDLGHNSVVVLGVRRDESVQRRRSLGMPDGEHWSLQREGSREQLLFMPIIDLSVQDVWDGLAFVPGPNSMDREALWDLYKDASDDCPVVRTPDDPPCGQGRFGCWLCTVVRKDRSAERMIAAGRTELQPLLDFRAWLLSVRNLPEYRASVRRNGRAALGPFRLSARQEILARLREAESLSGFRLVDEEEVAAIHREWHRDATNAQYREDA